ncbi:(2Fe-2S) ferredoxin domain-containing protein [Chitinispirillales bacterium ANBcel5]|uniref:(2Fe-2S) ferredoxin domain-containing protein n=1 Tax=Cellulosispirillum alkaliphilum TaxID=3039283 RepID=UPI002A519147|nr:(2Fe-2S) ferredoxin domain-containing protein [Chitinispirillales bacterium ANBcel5]
MSKITLEDLKKLREQKKKELSKRDSEGKTTQIIIGMGTCGIAAGAKDSFDAFLDEVDKNNLTDVSITQTGCMGLCYAEPTVEVIVPDMPAIVYGNVKADIAKRIVNEHVVGKALVNDHIFDKPAADILK